MSAPEPSDRTAEPAGEPVGREVEEIVEDVLSEVSPSEGHGDTTEPVDRSGADALGDEDGFTG